MKTGFLIQKLTPGGAERATVSIANEMSLKNENVEIITFDSENSFYEINDTVPHIKLNLSEIEKSLSLKRITGCIKRAFEIRKKIKSENLDVLVCMSTTMNLYGLISTLFTKTKVIGTERNNPYKYKADIINSVLKKVTALFLNGFVFQTNAASKYYAESVRKKSVVIQNAVFNPLAKSIVPCENRQKIIYGVGRLSNQKRFDDLINAFNLFVKTHPDYKLVIFGEGEDRAKLELLINSLSLNDKVLLPGTNKEALKFVSKGSVFVLSSDYEGMPNALMEAMAVGTPCVSTRCQMGPEELINDGENGILVSVGSVEEIKKGIEIITDNPSLSKSISNNCRNILKTNNVSVITEQWIEYIYKVKNKEC